MRYFNPRRRNAPPYKKDLFRTPNATIGFGVVGHLPFHSDIEPEMTVQKLVSGFGPVMVLEQTRRDESRDGADA